MDELRWALLGLGALFVGGLAVWELRKPRQGGSSGEDDATVTGFEPAGVRRLEPRFDGPAASSTGDDAYPAMRADDVGADPPVLVMDARRDSPATLDLAIAADVAVDSPGRPEHTEVPEAPEEVPPFDVPSEAVVPPEAPETPASNAPRLVPPEPNWPPEDQRQIVSLRVAPRPPARFGGRTLRQSLDACGLEYGAFDIYHLVHESGEVVASAANLMRPGTFSPANMDSQHFHGVHLFCVLPGPLPAGRAVDELIALARDLAQRLSGIVLDPVGQPLDEERAAVLRAKAEQDAEGG